MQHFYLNCIIHQDEDIGEAEPDEEVEPAEIIEDNVEKKKRVNRRKRKH